MDNNNDSDYDDDASFVMDDDEYDADIFFGIDNGSDDDDEVEQNVLISTHNTEDDKKAVKLDEKKYTKMGVVKSSFPALIKIRNKHHKKTFINTVQNMVIKNTEIAVRLGLIMHHVVMNCVDGNVVIPPNFGHPEFINAALNYNEIPTHPLLIAAREAFNPEFQPVHHDMTGRPWLLGYLASAYTGHIVSSTKKKWKAFINDSIGAYERMHLRNVDAEHRQRVKIEIRRQIFTPASNPPNDVEELDDDAVELVEFHRRGFRLQGQQKLDQWYINGTKGQFHYYVLHFGHCIRRLDNLELTWNNNHLPRDQIHLKKRLPLPFFRMQQRKSVKIDKKGLYFILREYRTAVRSSNPGFTFPNRAPDFPGKYAHFTFKLFGEWMRFLFRVKEVLNQTKENKITGVAITTNAVCASVLFLRRQPDPEEGKQLLSSIQQLSLTPLEEDNADDACEIYRAYENRYFDPVVNDSVDDYNMQDFEQVLNFHIWNDLNEFASVHVHDGVVDLQGRHYEITVDPGTENIMQIQVYLDGELVKTLRLTRDGYYEDSLLNYSTKRWIAWNNHPLLKELSTGSRIHHYKTSNMQQIFQSMQHYEGIAEEEHESTRVKIRERKLIPKKFERLRFLTYTKKQQTIHRFLSDLVRDCGGEEQPIMYYGDGSFASGGRGQRSVPCKWVKRECKNVFTCYSVNEFRTSQVCPTCNSRLLNVHKHLRSGDRPTRNIRGLKYCSSKICCAHRYKNRDLVGCTNIYRKTRNEYPEVLDRTGPRWANHAGTHHFRPPPDTLPRVEEQE